MGHDLAVLARSRHRVAVGCLAVVLAACGTTNPTPAPVASPSAATSSMTPSGLGLPLPAGASVHISSYINQPGNAIHAANFASVPGVGGTFYFDGGSQRSVPASIDLLVATGTRVLPVASGTVLSAWAECDVVVVEHQGGLLSEYIHVAVAAGLTPGAAVTASTSLGTVQAHPADWVAPSVCGTLENGPPHVHLAFAQESSSSHGTYLPLAGRTLCGLTVSPNGDLGSYWTVDGPPRPVPSCGANSPAGLATGPATPTLLPTPAPPMPTPRPPSTPRPTSRPTPKPSASATSLGFGLWRAVGNVMLMDNQDGTFSATTGDTFWAGIAASPPGLGCDYRFHAEAQDVSGDGYGVVVRATFVGTTPSGHGIQYDLGAGGYRDVEYPDQSETGQIVPAALDRNWHTIVVSVQGSTYAESVDGHRVFTGATGATCGELYVRLWRTTVEFRDLWVTRLP